MDCRMRDYYMDYYMDRRLLDYYVLDYYVDCAAHRVAAEQVLHQLVNRLAPKVLLALRNR